MSYQIDQSGKIEQTQRDTVIALANGTSTTILLKRQTKRILQELFRRQGQYRFFPYIIFSILIALMLDGNMPKAKVIIDTEYPGHEDLIHERIHFYLSLLGHKKLPPLHFGYVGKSSNADALAGKVARGREKPTKIARLDEVMDLLLEIKKDRES